MMVTVTYMAQLKQAAGVASECIELPPGGSVSVLVQHLADRHGERRGLLLAAGGARQPTILVFVNDTQVSAGEDVILQEGDEVTFLSPIAGG